MDPLTIIVTALAAGAAAGLKPTAAQAMKDAYAGLKALIQRKYSTVSLDLLEGDPGSDMRKGVVKEDLGKTEAPQDPDLLRQAQAVLNAVQKEAPQVAETVSVDLAGIQAATLELENIIAQGGGTGGATGVRIKGAGIHGNLTISGVTATNVPGPVQSPASSVPATSLRPITILFLAANPTDTTQLRLGQEVREIDDALRRAQYRDRFDLEQYHAVRVGDLQGLLQRHSPDIVHFSGHGSTVGEILLEDATGTRHPVTPRALSSVFALLKGHIRCVVLNACFSRIQAEAIAQHIECVIGMSTAISDAAAISFASAFYQALGYGQPLQRAFDLGLAQIDLENLAEQDTPQLIAHHGDPGQVRFIEHMRAGGPGGTGQNPLEAAGDWGRPAVSFDRVTAGGDITVHVTNLGTEDYHVVLAHSEGAGRELSLLLMQRALSPDRVRPALLGLAQRVTNGDLHYADRSIRAQVLYWSARVHATQPETLSIATSYLEQLHQSDPSTDIRIINALILETKGDVARALQILCDIDTPDGRATLFRTLFLRRGEETALAWLNDQPKRHYSSFLTGLGWSYVAQCLAKMCRWEEAADYLAAAEEQWKEWPDLAYVEGLINVAMLFPVEWRDYALGINPFYTEIQPIEGTEADRYRVRAQSCFKEARNLLHSIDQGDRARLAQGWLLWLRLTNPIPEVANEARQEVQEGMKDGRRAVHLLPAARRFGIEFNDDPLSRYLAQRAQMGGLVGQELLAEFLLAELKMDPRDYAEFLEREENRLSQVIIKATLVGKRIEAFVRDRQTVRARSLLEVHRAEFSEGDDERLGALIDASAGIDVRAQLEQNYSQTNDLLDLRNLINHLRQVRDWAALQPLLQELFRRERTSTNALQLIEAMHRQPQPDHAAILEFLEAHPDLVERDLDLTSAHAWALSHVGRLKDAEAINRPLLEGRSDPSDLLLETNLALQSGNWERFSGIVDRAWPQRETLDPTLLMRLASLAAEADQHANRALELAKLAAGKAANDPQILMSTYMLGVQLGREDETGGGWLARAIELSSDEGPVWRVNIRTMAEEMLPKRREQARRIERALLGGTVPLHAAAHEFHQPLSRLLIDLPRKNTDQTDGRMRTVVPIISGARPPVRIEPSWAVGFDISSLMVLQHLGLLKRTIDALQRVVLAPDTMVLLLSERRSVQFHQPSLVRKAEEIHVLIDRGALKLAPSEPAPPGWLVDEVGRDLAQLLEGARVVGGRVVSPYPVHKLSTFGETQAEIKEYAECLVSTIAFTEVLHTRGLLDSTTYKQARQFLQAHDRDPNPAADLSLLNRPLYLDDLALGYLQDAGALQTACRRGLTLLVHPSTQADQSALIEAHREGNRLAETLDELRVVLRDALESGQAIFLPRHHVPGEETPPGWLHKVAPVLAQLLRDASACDAVCVDDRFLNRKPIFKDEAGHTVPMVCVLDLLQYLEEQCVINTEEKQGAFYKLRQAGYGLVPVHPDELESYLRQVTLDQNGQISESAELRIIRQTLMRIRSLDMVELPTEAPFLEKLQLGCVIVIRHLWTDESLPVERAAALSDWMWRHVAPSPLDWLRNIVEPLRPDDMPEAYSRHLAWLLKPMPLNLKRYEAFRTWVEEDILAPLLPANADLVDSLVRIVRADIERLAEEFGNGEREADR